MNGLPERLWYLELQNKALKSQLASFKPGNAYAKLRNEYESIIREKDRKACGLENDLPKAHAQTIDSRNHWFLVYEGLEKETGAAMKSKDKGIERLEKRATKAGKQRGDALESAGEWRRKYYGLSGQAQDLEGLAQKLTAQVNKGFGNPSLPSPSQGAERKKIPNTRIKTGRKREAGRGMGATALPRGKPQKNITSPAQGSL